jgi:hypothetical protein
MQGDSMSKGIANDALPMLCAKRHEDDLFAMEIAVPPFNLEKIAQCRHLYAIHRVFREPRCSLVDVVTEFVPPQRPSIFAKASDSQK